MTSGPAAAPRLLAYVDRLTISPGDELELMVSSLGKSYKAEVIRLIHGAARGPGRRSEPVAALGRHAGEVQPLRVGSHLRVADDRRLNPTGLTISAWVFPTAPSQPADQTIISRNGEDGGWALGLRGGELAVWLGADQEPALCTGLPLRSHEWWFVAAAFAPDGMVTLVQQPLHGTPVDHRGAVTVRLLGGRWRIDEADLLIAARSASDGPVCGHFNGRIDRPTLSAGVTAWSNERFAPAAVARLPLLASWHAGHASSDTEIPDIGPHGLHATAVNFPARGIPGHNWSGREVDFRQAPDEFAALHFHDDDLTDAGWRPSFGYRVPEDLRSGVYAFHLREDDTDTDLVVPFYVRPPRGSATAPLAVLIPTMTYLAYANVHAGHRSGERLESKQMTPEHRWAAEHGLRSLYDVHSDGSGTYYASHRRPLTTLTPDHIDPLTGTLWNLSGDLCLIDWLEHEEFAHDVITDHILHEEGVELLSRYQTVVSGTHPEYYTAPMLDAHESYIARGGRYMYLGGNGYYWVTGVSTEEPSVIEIRRAHTGERTWEVAAGEGHLSTTGEIGGLWRHRGRPPQRHVGVGFTSQGTSASGRSYVVADGVASDPRTAFILDGVGDVIDGEGLISGNPAGSEIDRMDRSLGTPPHAITVATADGFSPEFTLAVEDVMGTASLVGPADPLVRSDLVFFETGVGGAVFATGSIAWSTALSDRDYGNPVARVTGNVLRRFLDPAPFRAE